MRPYTGIADYRDPQTFDLEQAPLFQELWLFAGF